MRAARIFVLAPIVIVIGYPATATAAQARSARTVDITIACPKDADFDRYATLLLDDISAAVLFKNDHDCVTLPKGTIVRIDQGTIERDSSHVCIRPVGSYDCLWTFAGHIKTEGAQ